MLRELFGSFAGLLSLAVILFMIVTPTIFLRIFFKKTSQKYSDKK
jgi:hypothetical protein